MPANTKPKDPTSVRTSLVLPPDLYRWLMIGAHADMRSFNRQVVYLLSKIKHDEETSDE